MDYKARITKYQNDRNWTTHHMAVEAGLNPVTVANWFSRNSTPTMPALEKLCKAFGITMSEFFNVKCGREILVHIFCLKSRKTVKKPRPHFFRMWTRCGRDGVFNPMVVMI